MAKNREHFEKPALSGSKPGEDEEETSSEETGSSDSGSESESEQGHTQFFKKPSSVSVRSSAKPQKSTSSSDDEDSGSDTNSGGHISKVKPLATRQMDEPQKSPTGKKKLKPKEDTPTPVKPVSAKRSADAKEDYAKDSKKKKKSKPEPETLVKQSPISGDDYKKPPFQRIFSEENEIVILEGLVDYAKDKKVDPLLDLLGFHEYIQKKVHVIFTRAQLQYKLRRLKKKYENNKKKKTNDKSTSFSKPLEQKSFELSEKIWGNENGKESAAGNPKSIGNAGKNTRNGGANTSKDMELKELKILEIENGDTQKLRVRRSIFNGEDAVEMIVKTAFEGLDGEKKEEIERGLKKLRIEEMELYLKQLDLLRAKTKLALDALKSSEF